MSKNLRSISTFSLGPFRTHRKYVFYKAVVYPIQLMIKANLFYLVHYLYLPNFCLILGQRM